MSGIQAWEWQALAKLAVGAALLIGSVIGLIIWLVKHQMGEFARQQALIFAKFNDGGEVHNLRADVEQIKRMMIHTNSDSTIVLRAMTGTQK